MTTLLRLSFSLVVLASPTVSLVAIVSAFAVASAAMS